MNTPPWIALAFLGLLPLVINGGCVGRPPKRCAELARLGTLPLPEGPLERSCEIRENERGQEELVGPYEIRKPRGPKVAAGQFVAGEPFGRWIIYDDQGKPKGHFDFAAVPQGSSERSSRDDSGLPPESRLVPVSPPLRALRPSDFILPGPRPSPR